MASSTGATLAYDPLGRLYQVTAPGGTITRFLYDGDALVAEYDGAGAMTRRYVHWDGADVPIISYDGATLASPSYLHADHQGSIVATSGAAGASQINRYDEYGIPAASNAGRFQYTGQIWLAELGMYYYKARIYSPTFGRFLQTDPVGYADQFNLYAYVGDDPVNHTDPTGLAGECDTGSLIPGNNSGCRVLQGYPTNQGGVPTSRGERAALAAGNADAYWGSRARRGDPLGELGVEFSLSRRGSQMVEESKSRLFETLLTRHGALVYQEHGLRIVAGGDRAAAAREYSQIRLHLAIAHMNAVDRDFSGRSPHLLSAYQIANYHWAVFAQHGLPANTFGGSPLFGTRAEIFATRLFWCWSCDR